MKELLAPFRWVPGLTEDRYATDGPTMPIIYSTGGQNPDPMTWQVWKVTRDGSASIFVQGAPLRQPNGIAFDPQGNVVIMKDGTKYVSSVQNGGVSRIRPGPPAELIAQNIPNPASMCYEAGANQLVIPMNANNGLAFIPLN